MEAASFSADSPFVDLALGLRFDATGLSLSLAAGLLDDRLALGLGGTDGLSGGGGDEEPRGDRTQDGADADADADADGIDGRERDERFGGRHVALQWKTGWRAPKGPGEDDSLRNPVVSPSPRGLGPHASGLDLGRGGPGSTTRRILRSRRGTNGDDPTARGAGASMGLGRPKGSSRKMAVNEDETKRNEGESMRPRRRSKPLIIGREEKDGRPSTGREHRRGDQDSSKIGCRPIIRSGCRMNRRTATRPVTGG